MYVIDLTAVIEKPSISFIKEKSFSYLPLPLKLSHFALNKYFVDSFVLIVFS